MYDYFVLKLCYFHTKTRTDDVSVFGIISIAVPLAGSDIVERVSLLWIKVLKKTVNSQHSQLFENIFGYFCKKNYQLSTLSTLVKILFVKKLSTVNTLNIRHTGQI